MGHDRVDQQRLWGIVLAGGEGERLKGFVREVLGTEAPKQFCAFLGPRTMVEHTLRRAETIIPRERLMIVAAAHHRDRLLATLSDRPPGTVLLQPAGRDTGPGILLPLVHVLRRDPQALVAILPADHFVRPGRRFMRAVDHAAQYVRASGDESVVLLAVDPTDAEPEYGWLEPGPPVAGSGLASVRRITRFIEKPTREQAVGLLAAGWLWNSMVVVARAESLLKLVRNTAPELAAYFSMIRRAIGTPWESEVLQDTYRMMPSMNFSRSVLARRPDQLLVLRVTGVLWSDWGRGDRIQATLTRLGLPQLPPARSNIYAGSLPLGGLSG